VQADDPEMLCAMAELQANSVYAFSVTLKHPDAGWSHYADGWDILDLNGKKIETRTLYHPHANNEPFTRSLANVKIPIGMNFVSIRANCSVDGPAQKLYRLELPPRYDRQTMLPLYYPCQKILKW